ncbi:MAG: RNA polymerase factor sigma-54 [Kiritimatiellaeota bacterium]|nr:RNA polymerase factor sigma-54 [Kiritimatiellota bacterium]
MVQQQRQVQTMVPQLRQSLEMLQMPVLALRQAILKEMSVNPAIEDVVSPNEVVASSIEPEPAGPAAADGELDFSPDVDALLRQDDEWRDYFLQGMENAPAAEDDEEKRQHFYDSIRQPVSLQEHLLEQVPLTALSAEDREIAVLLIGNINDDGYFTGSLPDLMMVTGKSKDELIALLNVVQTFDPPGVGARDLRECLLLQLSEIEDSPWEDEARALIDKHLERLAAHDEKFLCKALALTPDELQRLVAFIRTFNPRPGRAFERSEVEYVEPEVIVVKEKGRYVAKVDGGLLPHIHISKHYRKLLEDPAVPAETKSYIRERIRAGAFLIRSIEQRQETIRQIAQTIVDAQTAFITDGIRALRPMTMTEVAEKVSKHETTVSRTVSNKYMRTPRGVFEMKYFFTSGLKTASGDSVSNKSIQDQIAQMIEQEDPADPLSDNAIQHAFAERGVTIARRTVAKYRSVRKIPPAHERRRG